MEDPSATRRIASRARVTNPRDSAASSSSWAGCTPGHEGVEIRVESKDLGKRDPSPVALMITQGTANRAKREERGVGSGLGPLSVFASASAAGSG